MEFLIKQQEEKDFKKLQQTDAAIFNNNIQKFKKSPEFLREKVVNRHNQEVDEAIVVEIEIEKEKEII